MALPHPSSFLYLLLLLLLLALLSLSTHIANATTTSTATTLAFQWTSSTGDDADEEVAGEDPTSVTNTRRALFWYRAHFYISYGALAADRVPCPPRSGRSYYTHNCYYARGPVHPYSRGCSAITQCRR